MTTEEFEKQAERVRVYQETTEKLKLINEELTKLEKFLIAEDPHDNLATWPTGVLKDVSLTMDPGDDYSFRAIMLNVPFLDTRPVLEYFLIRLRDAKDDAEAILKKL